MLGKFQQIKKMCVIGEVCLHGLSTPFRDDSLHLNVRCTVQVPAQINTDRLKNSVGF